MEKTAKGIKERIEDYLLKEDYRDVEYEGTLLSCALAALILEEAKLEAVMMELSERDENLHMIAKLTVGDVIIRRGINAF